MEMWTCSWIYTEFNYVVEFLQANSSASLFFHDFSERTLYAVRINQFQTFSLPPTVKFVMKRSIKSCYPCKMVAVRERLNCAKKI